MWYQLNPNVELLKQANVWNGISQNIKDFFEGANRNELLKLNRQNEQLNADRMRQELQQNAEMHPLAMQGLQTQNAHNAHKFKMASLYDAPMFKADLAQRQADLAHKRALTDFTNRQTANIGRGRENDALGVAKTLAGISKMFSKSPAQINQEKEELRQNIIAQFPHLSNNSEIVDSMVSDYLTFGTYNTPDKGFFYDSYESLADTKSKEELEKLRRLRAQSDPQAQLNNAIMQILGLQSGMLGSGVYAPPPSQTKERKDSPSEREAINALTAR